MIILVLQGNQFDDEEEGFFMVLVLKMRSMLHRVATATF